MGDVEALVAVTLAIAGQAHRFVELDVNPMIVRRAGEGVVAVDVLVRL